MPGDEVRRNVRSIMFKGSPFDSNTFMFTIFVGLSLTSLIYKRDENLNKNQFSYYMMIIRLCFTIVNFFFIKYIKYINRRIDYDEIINKVYYQKSFQMIHVQWLGFLFTAYCYKGINYNESTLILEWIITVAIIDVIYIAVFILMFGVSNRNPCLGVTLLNYFEFASLDHDIKNQLDDMSILYKNLDQESKNSSDECIICISEFEDDELITKLKCGHVYHKGCVYEWFKQKSECPCCRDKAIKLSNTNVDSTYTIFFKGRRHAYDPI